MTIPQGVKSDQDVTTLGAFRTPAHTDWLYVFEDITKKEELMVAYRWAREKKMPVVILAGGTNSLLCFDRFPGLIIHNKTQGWKKEGDSLWVASGELISVVSILLKTQHHNPVFEAWIGLPGSFGGALFGNAGCFGLEVSQALESAEILDFSTGEVQNIFTKDFHFSYRKSCFSDQPNWLILSAKFRINSATIPGWKPVESSLLERKARQPVDKPTCGSFFKNPMGDFAGRLIEAAGWKGTKIGGAQISEKHANFFQNAGGATWQDILALRDKVQNGVFEKFGVMLESEVRCITSPVVR